MTNTRAVGCIGEDIAAAHLRRRGYALRGRNVRVGRGEIDVIAYDAAQRCLVFVEVKHRSSFDPDYPAEALLTRRKKMRMLRAARAWVDRHDYRGSYRIDAVCIEGDRILHIEDLHFEESF